MSLTWRILRLISTLGGAARPVALFLKAPPACAGTTTLGAATVVGSTLRSGEVSGKVRLGDVDGPASGSLSFSESEESNSEDEPSGCVDRIFGFQSAYPTGQPTHISMSIGQTHLSITRLHILPRDYC